MKITAKAVAKKAGVSAMTVSRVLHGTGYASKEIRKRVEEAARELDYLPNALARGIHTGKTSVIGVLIPVRGEFDAHVVHGVYEELFQRGYSMLLGWPPKILPEKSDTTELTHINRMLEQQVEGLIIHPSHDDAKNQYFEDVFKKNKPMVCIDRDLPNANINFVGTDDNWGSEQIARKLLDYNHRSFLLVNGPLQISSAQQRNEGFKHTLNQVQGTKCFETYNNHHTADWIEDAIAIIKDKKPTAAFCFNDIDATLLINAANKIGIRTPEDISIVGYSGLKNLQRTQPKILSTMYFEPSIIGKEAVNLLLDSISNETNPPRRTLLRPTWIEGETIAKIEL